MSFEQAREYLARVLPWPQQGEGASYVNIHWTFKSEKYDKPGWSGRSVSTVDDAVKAIEFALKAKDTRDIYACQSTQRETQQMTSGRGFKYLKPVRLQENAVLLKSLFLDIDVKEPIPGKELKGYPTMAEALAALGGFIKAVGLPKPSMIVSSGGGLHVYWTMMRALTPAEWYPLACALIEATKRHGLKLDEAVTTDAARVLRIPDTFNCKLDVARCVRIAGKPVDFDYTVERISKCLEPYKVEAIFLAQRVGTLQFEQPDASVAPRAPLAGVSDLSAGIETAMPQAEVRACLDEIPNTKVDWNYWNTIGMRVYAATEGSDYGLAEWQAWSDTNTVSGGADSCASRWDVLHTSPPTRTGAGALVNEVRSIKGDDKWQVRGVPGHVAPGNPGAPGAGNPPGAPPGNVGLLPPQVTAPVKNIFLPDGYTRTKDGRVMLIGVNEDGTPSQTPVSDYPILDGWLQKSPWKLHFTTIMELGQQAQISIGTESVGGMDMRKILQGQGFMLRIVDKLAKEFLVAWIQKLQASKASIECVPFGWSDDAVHPGFVYGSRMFSPSGETQSATADPVLAKHYSPRGELQPWLDACDLVTLQERPGLNAILATAFAGPIVKFSGEKGLLLSAWSSDSGIGKTTAVNVAQAVWGKPSRIQGLDDTQNSTFGKMGQLKNISMYWDEIKTEEDFKAFAKMAFKLTKGSEKSRMRANTTIHESGEWQTILTVCANDSVLSYIVQQTNTSPAGLLRIFEYEVTRGTIHQIDQTDATRLAGKLADNYGHAGLIYAKFLGENETRLYDEYGVFAKAFAQEVKASTEERFWMILLSSLQLGAKYANQLGLTDIDEPALKRFLIERLQVMRETRRTETNDMRKGENVANVLARFFAATQGRHTIWTNRIHITTGKPPKGSVKVVRPADRLDGAYVQIGEGDKLVRISRTYLYEWLKIMNISPHIFATGLKDEFGSKVVHGYMASGTALVSLVPEYLLEINLAGHPLADMFQ